MHVQYQDKQLQNLRGGKTIVGLHHDYQKKKKKKKATKEKEKENNNDLFT